MNLILLTEDHLTSPEHARVKGRVLKHLRDVLHVQAGQTLHVGLLNGKMGVGKVEGMERDSVSLKILLNKKPPPPSPVRLVMALPRPIVLKRLLPQITALGVKDIVLLQTKRVEKSYWASPVLFPENMKEQMMLGLEQAKDTVLPEVLLRKRFKPFVEDEFPDFKKGTTALLAHPQSEESISRRNKKKVTLVIGPEGGFVPFEVDCLKQAGCSAVHMGERILKVETAVVGLISQLNNR